MVSPGLSKAQHGATSEQDTAFVTGSSYIDIFNYCGPCFNSFFVTIHHKLIKATEKHTDVCRVASAIGEKMEDEEDRDQVRHQHAWIC